MRRVFAARRVAMARIPLAALDTPVRSVIGEGIFLASRSLDQADPSPRTASAKAAYALRAATRTTPNSVWCAAAVATLDGSSTEPVRLEGGFRTLTLPAPAWLLVVADQLLEETLPQLTVTANNLTVRRGGRWEATHLGADGTADVCSVATTDLTDWLLSGPLRPIAVEQLRAQIQDRYPSADTPTVRAAVAQLIRSGLLLTDLLPEDLTDAPLDHLAARLPLQHPVRQQLTELSSLLREADGLPPGDVQRLELLRRAQRLADAVHRVERPFTVDTVADDQIRVPADVGVRAAEAASLLWRIGHRTGPLQAWTHSFARKFGRHRLVPLLDAVDPVLGIGPPAPEDSIGAASALDSGRTRYLSGLFTDALTCGAPEVALTDEDVARLGAPAGPAPPVSAEIHIRLLQHLDGTLGLAVGPHAAQDASSASARFRHLLPDLLPTMTEAVGASVVAEIACRSSSARTAALTPECGILPYRIPIGVPVRPGDLNPADLAVTYTGTRLLVWSHQLGAPVRPVLLSRITRDLLPPAAHLLYLLGHSGERPWHPFTWTPVVPHAAYTPRVTWRGTVLAPQRWSLPDHLTAAAARRSTWCTQLDAWLNRAMPRLPDLVVAEESDRHLPLTLATPEHREILRRTVAAGTRTLAEAIGHAPASAPLQGPHGKHLLELVVALDCQLPAPPGLMLDPRTAPRPLGSDLADAREWTSVAVAVPLRHQDAALRLLPPLSDVGLSYWLRYHTAALGPHLRVRTHTATAELRAHIQNALQRWAAHLTDQCLSDGLLHHEPYLRETQRYGGPDAIEAAERVFAADSALAHSSLDLSDNHRLLLAARTIVVIATTLTPEHARQAIEGSALTAPERRKRDELRPAARQCGESAQPHLARADQALRAALTELAQRLEPQTAPLVARDLIHMHSNRILGTDVGTERVARSLALDVLHRP